MKADEFTTTQLHSGEIAYPVRWSIHDLFKAGYDQQELYDINPSPTIGVLKIIGSENGQDDYKINDLQSIINVTDDTTDPPTTTPAFTISDFVGIGYTLRELKEDGNYKATELKDQTKPGTNPSRSFKLEELYADESGLLFTFYDLKNNAGYSANDFIESPLKGKNGRQENITPSELQTLGFSVSNLYDAGFTRIEDIVTLKLLQNDILHLINRSDTTTGDISTTLIDGI